jgi:hypothetical protein
MEQGEHKASECEAAQSRPGEEGNRPEGLNFRSMFDRFYLMNYLPLMEEECKANGHRLID